MLTAAIVLYHNDVVDLEQAVNSFLSIPLEKRLYLIDNSKTAYLGKLFDSKEINYIYTGQNLGFGKGHNYILNELRANSKYHLILNPDAYFEKDVLSSLIEEMRSDETIGIIAPKIVYPNGNFQNSVRKFPKLWDLMIRRIPGLKSAFPKAFKNANYLNGKLDRPIDVDAVSGCFQVFRTKVLLEIGGFDERYFMYMEDLDICRTVHAYGYKVRYYPLVKVYHRSAYGSKRSFTLLAAHIKSAIKYFMKWKS